VNGFGKHAAGKTLDVQVFHDDGSEVLHQFVGLLVLKMFALVGDVGMRLLQQQDCFMPAIRLLI